MAQDRSYVRTPLTAESLAWVSEQCGGARILSTEFLTGGISHSNFAFSLDGHHDVVLRRWVRPGWYEDEPEYDVRREVAALTVLERAGIRAPRVIATDPDGVRCGVPAILMTRLPGTHAEPDMAQLAEVCLAIHQISPPWLNIPEFEIWHDRAELVPPENAVRNQVWERAFAATSVEPPAHSRVFLHRDYHPGNTLWQDGRLTGVVDWTTASLGAPGFDLGHMRWNLVSEYGITAADEFLHRYQEFAGDSFAYDPYWDLLAVVDALGGVPAHTDPTEWESYVERLLM